MKKHLFYLLLAISLAFVACESDGGDCGCGTQQEAITTVLLTFSGTNMNPTTYKWEDIDGAGGNDPVIETVSLPPLTSNVKMSIAVLNRSGDAEEDITQEIAAEEDEHLFLFDVTDANLTFLRYDDFDANGKPVGLRTTWMTGEAGSGTLQVELRHEPTDKDNTDDPGGDVDIRVFFPVEIQ